jgi:hypothetical protein
MSSAQKRHKQRRDRNGEQVNTVRCSATVEVDSPSFVIGVADLRAGTPPRFDEMQDEYCGCERGCQWAGFCPYHNGPPEPHDDSIVRGRRAAEMGSMTTVPRTLKNVQWEWTVALQHKTRDRLTAETRFPVKNQKKGLRGLNRLEVQVEPIYKSDVTLHGYFYSPHPNNLCARRNACPGMETGCGKQVKN